MPFQIHALPKQPFAALFALSDSELWDRNMRRVTADTHPGFPCRVSLADADPGEELILLNHQHLDAASPYAASHAIYVRKDADQAQPAADHVPEVLTRRLLSVRGFNAESLMVEADVVDGGNLAGALNTLFANPEVTFVHIHNAKQGCFAAKATRA